MYKKKWIETKLLLNARCAKINLTAVKRRLLYATNATLSCRVSIILKKKYLPVQRIERGSQKRTASNSPMYYCFTFFDIKRLVQTERRNSDKSCVVCRRATNSLSVAHEIWKSASEWKRFVPRLTNDRCSNLRLSTTWKLFLVRVSYVYCKNDNDQDVETSCSGNTTSNFEANVNFLEHRMSRTSRESRGPRRGFDRGQVLVAVPINKTRRTGLVSFRRKIKELRRRFAIDDLFQTVDNNCSSTVFA